MILGLGYNFYNSLKSYGPTKTVLVENIIALILAIIFIELIIYFFIKIFKKTKYIKSK